MKIKIVYLVLIVICTTSCLCDTPNLSKISNLETVTPPDQVSKNIFKDVNITNRKFWDSNFSTLEKNNSCFLTYKGKIIYKFKLYFSLYNYSEDTMVFIGGRRGAQGGVTYPEYLLCKAYSTVLVVQESSGEILFEDNFDAYIKSAYVLDKKLYILYNDYYKIIDIKTNS